MPVSIHDVYRDAADRRITWEEALRMTIIIDENGNVRKPATDTEKQMFATKVDALRPYVKTLNDPYLLDIAKMLYMYN